MEIKLVTETFAVRARHRRNMEWSSPPTPTCLEDLVGGGPGATVYTRRLPRLRLIVIIRSTRRVAAPTRDPVGDCLRTSGGSAREGSDRGAQMSRAFAGTPGEDAQR